MTKRLTYIDATRAILIVLWLIKLYALVFAKNGRLHPYLPDAYREKKKGAIKCLK